MQLSFFALVGVFFLGQLCQAQPLHWVRNETEGGATFEAGQELEKGHHHAFSCTIDKEYVGLTDYGGEKAVATLLARKNGSIDPLTASPDQECALEPGRVRAQYSAQGQAFFSRVWGNYALFVNLPRNREVPVEQRASLYKTEAYSESHNRRDLAFYDLRRKIVVHTVHFYGQVPVLKGSRMVNETSPVPESVAAKNPSPACPPPPTSRWDSQQCGTVLRANFILELSSFKESYGKIRCENVCFQ